MNGEEREPLGLVWVVHGFAICVHLGLVSLMGVLAFLLLGAPVGLFVSMGTGFMAYATFTTLLVGGLWSYSRHRDGHMGWILLAAAASHTVGWGVGLFVAGALSDYLL